jgi:chaperonin cofactor prefoldin
MDMTKWKITPRVRRTYREGSAWEAVFDVQQKSGWGHDWHSMESFSSREDAQKFILDYQRAEGTLRETPLSSLETHVWKRFGTIWAELRSLWTKIGEVSNAVEKLAADRTDLSLRVNALHNRADVLEERVKALEPKSRTTRTRRRK